MKVRLFAILMAVASAPVVGFAAPPVTPYVDALGDDVATISYSANEKFQTREGSPMNGEPLVCVKGETFSAWHKPSVNVEADIEVAVTIVSGWNNAGWVKTCWPFVSFKPDRGAKYIVVNERIGGKGIKALWTGVGRQHCRVSVYKESESGPVKVATQKADMCGYAQYAAVVPANRIEHEQTLTSNPEAMK